MITCVTDVDGKAQALVAKDHVPIAADVSLPPVIDSPQILRICRLDLTDCKPISATSFPEESP